MILSEITFTAKCEDNFCLLNHHFYMKYIIIMHKPQNSIIL